MSQSLSTIIKGVTLNEALFIAALEKLPTSGFSKTEFAQALLDAGLNEANDGDLVRGAMQFLKRQGIIEYDAPSGAWSLSTLGQMRLPHRTLPLLSTDPAPVAVLKPSRTDWWAELGRLSFSAIACLILLTALVGLNASFAWELGREAAQFQILFTMGVTALDMMRPGFVLMGFWLSGTGHRALGGFALAIALVLSPVSVLSTTSILSASFLLGAEFNTDAETRAATREALRVQHENLLQRAAQNEAAWRQECARGGCGPIAQELEAEFQRTVSEAQEVLNQIVALTEAEHGNSELLARMVTTFEELGLFGNGRQIWLPLFLAISLELGALFGPALLLRRK
ncbi:hypothetical protein [Nioella sp. MMSF_3534]|uniref:hypothetical protein n=1 Tax=Nioella sp. MMSF_3534 TaxID=3046720 RepID=UPI00273E0603|nr:hypothetical protein [Nioella sp. MMSF_3534]